MITALVFLATLIIKFPVGPDCYIHLGDAVILVGVVILPRKHACFAGAVGAALADMLGGYAFWAPWTFFIKLACVIVFSLCINGIKDELKDHKAPMAREMIGYILVTAVGVIGYFVAEYLMFGNWVAAAACIIPNILQVGSGCLLCYIVSRRILVRL